MTVTTAWQTVRDDQYLTIVAGASRAKSLRGHGEILMTLSNPCRGNLGPTTVDTTDGRTGPLTLSRVRYSIVSFTFPGGRGTLSLLTHHFAISHA
jgi:hypothetical protein